jgi:plastocyanin
MRVCTSLACLILAACGSSGSSSTPDAAAMADAAAAPSVRAVTCPPGDMPTVTTSDAILAFTPGMTTISAHGIVKFVMSPAHDVTPNPLRPSDPGLMVDYGKTTCLTFDKAGTFNFMCASHGFVGTIVVE